MSAKSLLPDLLFPLAKFNRLTDFYWRPLKYFWQSQDARKFYKNALPTSNTRGKDDGDGDCDGDGDGDDDGDGDGDGDCDVDGDGDGDGDGDIDGDGRSSRVCWGSGCQQVSCPREK